MEQTKCKNNVILQKIPEIKTIIDDLKELIEIYGCNYSERTMNIFKKHLTNQEYFYCDDYGDKIEDLNRCIASLNNLRNKYLK